MVRAAFITIALLMINITPLYAADHSSELKIGVLAKRGSEITLQRWNKSAEYLSQTIQGYHFTIIPLSFEAIDSAVREKRIDFLLTNSGMFMNLSFKYGLTSIATLKRKILGEGQTKFGSVVFSRKTQQGSGNFNDLKGRHVVAVNPDSFGGWIMADRELLHDGIRSQDFASLSFLGTHDAVVYAVIEGKADFGVVRTDTLERMQAEGKIDLNALKVITSKRIESGDYANENKQFPFLLSSRLYPEWPFASLSHINDHLVEEVSASLISITPDSEVANAAMIVGWTIPKNYREVALAYSELKLGVFAELTKYTFSDVIKRYWHYFLTGFFFLTVMLGVLLYIYKLNRLLKESEEKMRVMATHDALTGLPNRTMFYEVASKFLSLALRQKQEVMFAFVDLDQFKAVNDTYGHDAGDYLLKELSARISASLRTNDIIARIGGDEFLLMLWNSDSVEDSASLFDRIISAVSLPVLDAMGNKLEVGCSIGVSSFPTHGDALEDLIKKADLALYQAKEKGRGQYIVYRDKG